MEGTAGTVRQVLKRLSRCGHKLCEGLKNIFPFQEEADIMFNSALVYELAVLKKYAEPLFIV